MVSEHKEEGQTYCVFKKRRENPILFAFSLTVAGVHSGVTGLITRPAGLNSLPGLNVPICGIQFFY